MSKIRKAFVVGIMTMTVLSMSVVVAPTASAASAGDLIKMDGLSSVYYLGADGKRYVFPNESTYFSWYAGFSSVVTVAQSELESYPLGKNVTVRPGTKLVKITTDPKVYAVEPGGDLLWVPSEAVAKTLYGDMWAKRVIDVADSFFTNYNVTGEQVSDDAYPAGSLVKYGEDPTVYWIGTDGKAYPFADEAAFNANRFKWDDVLNATIAKPAVGDAITGAIAAVIDTSSGAGGQAGAGTGLTIALSGDTPGSVNIPGKSTLVPYLAVNLTASNDGDVTVQQLTFTRRGTGNPSDFDGGYLFVGNERLTNKRTVNTSDNKIQFSALNLTIPSGKTKTVMLKMNADASVGGNHYFELASASMVSTNGAVVSGSFPIEGNLMSYASTVNAATVQITGTLGATAERKVGESDVVLSEFDIANNNQEEVYVYSIRLKNNGTASDASVGNLSLDIDGNIVASEVDMASDYITFVLDTPYKIKKSETVSAVIRGDVLTDVGKTLIFFLKDVGDADVRGSAYGDFYSATLVNRLDVTETDTTSVWGSDLVTNNDTVIDIKGSEINVSFDGPQAAEVKDDNDNVVFANFMIKSESEDVSIDTLTVTLAQGGAINNTPLENFELVDSNNNVTYGADSAPASSTSQGISFSNVLLSAGTQYNFEIQGDIQDNTAAGATFSVSIDFSSGFTADYVQSDTAVVPANDISSLTLNGKTMTVASPSLVTARVTTNAISTVKEADGVLLYKGKLTATNVDDIKITKIVATSLVGDIGDYLSASWEKLYLYRIESNGTETLLDSETSLGVNTVNFSGFTLTVPKGISNGIYYTVRGDVKNTPTATTTEIKMASGWTVKDSDNNTVTATSIDTSNYGHITTVVGNGTISVEVNTEETGINNDKNVLAGSAVLIGRLKLTATNEAAELDDLVLTNFGSATNSTLARVCLYEDKEMTELVQCMDVDSAKRAFFQDLNFEVPTAGVTYLYIGAEVKGIDYSSSPTADSTATAGNTIRLYVPTDVATYNFKATGVSTGEELTSPFASASSTAWTKQSTVMGAIISGLSTTFANGVLTAGTAKDVFSFKVTVPESSNVDYDGAALGAELGTVTFTVSTSSYAISNIRVERVGGSNGEQSGAGFTNPTANSFAIDFETAYGTDSDLIVRPGDTAEFVVRANVTGTADSGSVQVTIESVDSNVTFDHNYGVAGEQGSDVTDVAPRLSGVSNVRGGTLSK